MIRCSSIFFFINLFFNQNYLRNASGICIVLMMFNRLFTCRHLNGYAMELDCGIYLHFLDDRGWIFAHVFIDCMWLFFLRNDLFLLWCWIMCASLIDFFKFLLYSILFQFTIHLFIVFEAYFTNFSVLIIFAMKSNLCFLGTGWLHCLTCPILSAWFESQLFRFQCNILVVCTLSSSGW